MNVNTPYRCINDVLFIQNYEEIWLSHLTTASIPLENENQETTQRRY